MVSTHRAKQGKHAAAELCVMIIWRVYKILAVEEK